MMIITSLAKINKFNQSIVFLAGSITDWRDRLVNQFKHENVTFVHPINNSIDWNTYNNKLISQIDWELNSMMLSNYIFMNICKNTNSKISLIDFGLNIKSNKLIINCDKEFDTYKNIRFICEKFNIPLFTDFNIKFENSNCFKFLYNEIC